MRLAITSLVNTIRALTKLFILLCILPTQVAANNTAFTIVNLKNEVLQLALTPDIGGRITQFNLIGYPNFLKVGDDFRQAKRAKISAFSDNIGYLGHIVWVGPQSQWWQQQEVNQTRRQEKAQWPPDPFTIFSNNTITEHNENKIQLQGVNSSVTGLRIDKEISLDPVINNQVNIKTTASNISNKQLAWDLWFNSRVNGDTYIIAPVESKEDVKVTSLTQEEVAGIEVSFINNNKTYFVEFDVTKLSREKASNQGKLFIQPNQGWLAGFNQGQLFIIEFPWHRKEEIHPEHGQIEIYANYHPNNSNDSLIEMEFHSPYETLNPDQKMSVTAKWRLFSYPTHWNKQQLLALLKTKLKD